MQISFSHFLCESEFANMSNVLMRILNLNFFDSKIPLRTADCSSLTQSVIYFEFITPTILLNGNLTNDSWTSMVESIQLPQFLIGALEFAVLLGFGYLPGSVKSVFLNFFCDLYFSEVRAASNFIDSATIKSLGLTRACYTCQSRNQARYSASVASMLPGWTGSVELFILLKPKYRCSFPGSVLVSCLCLLISVESIHTDVQMLC